MHHSLSRPAGEGRGEGGGRETHSTADQDGPKVVDVGERRAGDDAVAQGLKETVGVIALEAVGGMDAQAACALQRVG